MNTLLQIILNKKIYKSIFLFFAFLYLTVSTLTPVHAEGNPFIPTTDILQTGLSPQVGAEELSTASTDIAQFSDITGAYYDATLNRIVFIGITTGTQKYNQDDMAVAIKSIFYNNIIPDVSIGDDPNNPGSSTAIATYSNGLQNTNFGSVLFNADYKYKQYAIGYDQNGHVLTSIVPTYKSVVNRYLALQSNPVVGNESKYILSPQNITILNATSSSSIAFNNLTMQATTQPVNQNNDTLWNQAANNFASDITSNFNQYAQESPYLSQAQQLSKITAILKWIQDYSIQSDFHSLQNYAPQFVSTPTTVQKVSTPIGSYSAQGEINYNTPNTYIPDNGTAAGLKIAAQAGSTSREDITWTFTNGGQQYQAVAVAADAFKSLGGFSIVTNDFSTPIAGDLNIEFQRSYSSFSNAQKSIGLGWDMMPARLYNNSYPQALNIVNCNNVLYIGKLAVDTPNGHETYSYNCTNGYTADDSSFHSTMVLNGNGTTTVISPSQIKYNFDSNLKLTSVVDKNNNTINFTYDGSNRLISIADTKNHVLTLGYNGQSLLTSVTDWSGRKVLYAYDTTGRLNGVTDPNGNTTTYGYDSNSRLVTVTDRTGQVILTNTYNSDGRIATQKTASGLTRTNTYDNTNKIITQMDNNGRTTKTNYDSNARIIQQTDSAGKNITFTYGAESVPLTQTDRNGNKTIYTYDSHGNVTSTTYPNTSFTTYTYDTSNRLTKILDNRYSPTKESDYNYDANGNLTQKSIGGLITKYTYDTNGEILSSTDPLNNTTSWTRDGLGNPLIQTDALNKTTTYAYDAIGRLTKQTDANNNSILYTYDANGNLLTKIDTVGTTTNTFDKENRLTKVTLPNNTYIQYSFNASGSLTKVTNPLNNTTSYGYDTYNNLINQQDALNHTTTDSYNVLNRPTQSSTPLGNVTGWQYDANGNITQRTDANGKITTYQYDSLNHLTKITYPDTSTVSYQYDNRGNMTNMIDTNGTSTYTYDSFDRLTKATNPFNQSLQYAYDNGNNITQITYPDTKIVSYSYDKDNRMTSVTDWNNKTTTYTYNNNGTLATRAYPNGITTYYTYDSANRLTSVEHKKGSSSYVKFAYTRDSVGNITAVANSGFYNIGSPYTDTFAYDSVGKITNAVYGYPQANITYTYDAVGNILSRVDPINSTSVSYTYDGDNRMVTAGGSSVSYDTNGNQISEPFFYPATLKYNFENNLSTYTNFFGNDTYKYDGLGNRLEFDDRSNNKTRYITDINGSLSHVLEDYSLSFNQVSGWYEYGLGLIANWQNDSSNVSANYYLEDGQGNVRFTTDYTGSIGSTLSYDPYGMATYQSGNGFGAASVKKKSTGKSVSNAGVVQNSASPGYEYDQQHLDTDTGFYYLRARYYDPSTARFLTKDPVAGDLQNPMTQNPYIYGLDNPINKDDPTGHDAQSVAQILQNQAQGSWYENMVLSALGFTKNTSGLDQLNPNLGLGKFIPDIFEREIIGEIKSGSYIYKSNQIQAFIKYAALTPGMRFRLYVKPGIKISQPLMDMISEYGGKVVTIGASSVLRLIDAAFIFVIPPGVLPSEQKNVKS